MLNMNGNAEQPLRAALYARVSTDDQRERQTIDTQTGALRNFAPHWDMTIVDEYLDDGISGTIKMEKRPEGARLMEDARERKFDVAGSSSCRLISPSTCSTSGQSFLSARACSQSWIA